MGSTLRTAPPANFQLGHRGRTGRRTGPPAQRKPGPAPYHRPRPRSRRNVDPGYRRPPKESSCPQAPTSSTSATTRCPGWSAPSCGSRSASSPIRPPACGSSPGGCWWTSTAGRARSSPGRTGSPSEVVDLLRRQMQDRGQFHFDRVPPYLDMADRMGSRACSTWRACVPDVPRGAGGRATGCEVTLRRGAAASRSRSASRTYTDVRDAARASARTTSSASTSRHPARVARLGALPPAHGSGFDHVRLDVVALEADPEAADPRRPELVDLVVDLGGRRGRPARPGAARAARW